MIKVTNKRVEVKGSMEDLMIEFYQLLGTMPSLFKDCDKEQIELTKRIFNDSIEGKITPSENALDNYIGDIVKAYFEKDDEDEECPCKEKKKTSDNLSEFDKVIAEVIGKLAKEFDLEKTIVRAICEDDIMALRITGGVVTMMGVGDEFSDYIRDEAYEKFKNDLKKKLNK